MTTPEAPGSGDNRQQTTDNRQDSLTVAHATEQPARTEQPVDERFRTILTRGTTEALTRVDATFGGDPFQDPNQLAYHRGTHSRGVVNRYQRLARAIQQTAPDLMPERGILLGEFITASHDEIQKWRENPDNADPQGRPMRKRKRALGDNERATADRAVAYLTTANEETGEEITTGAELQTVRDAIELTIPNFDVQKGTVTQPEFGDHTANVVVQTAALADLGAGGMEGFPTARWETDALLVEENLDFAAYVAHIDAGEERNAAEEAKYTDRMLGWLESQRRFSIGRQRELQEEITTMNPRVQEPVRALFSKYDETIAGMGDFIETRRGMDFDTWIADVKTTLNNPPEYPVVDRKEG